VYTITRIELIFQQPLTKWVALAALIILPLIISLPISAGLQQYLPKFLRAYLPHVPHNERPTDIDAMSSSLLSECKRHSYTTEIISLNPLVIYINNFTSAAEAEALIKLGYTLTPQTPHL